MRRVVYVSGGNKVAEAFIAEIIRRSPGSRRPHWTSSLSSIQGTAFVTSAGDIEVNPGECARADGSTLILQNLQEWRQEVIEAIAVAWHDRYVRVHVPKNKYTVNLRAGFDVAATWPAEDPEDYMRAERLLRILERR